MGKKPINRRFEMKQIAIALVMAATAAA